MTLGPVTPVRGSSPWWRRLQPSPWVWVAAATGLALRIWAPMWATVAGDGGGYAAMAHALRGTGSLVLPWGDAASPGGDPAPSHHYPPLWPAIEALGLAVGLTPAWTSAITGIACAAAAWAMSRDLYGRRWGLLCGAASLVAPRLVLSSATGYSEQLVCTLFLAVLWCLARAERDGGESRWTVGAGAAAGMAYLAKSTMGAFFVVAAAGGLAWRLRRRGLASVATDRSYLAGAAVFAATAGAWSLRNVATFGWPHWQTSLYNDQLAATAWSHPGLLAYGLVMKTAIFAAFALLYLLLVRWKRPTLTAESELMGLASVLVLVLGAAMSAVYWVGEGTPILWPDVERYAVVAMVPLLWFAAASKQPLPSPRRAAAWFLAMALVAGTGIAGSGRFCDWEGVHGGVHPGESYAYSAGSSLYSTYTAAPAGSWASHCSLWGPTCSNATGPDAVLVVDHRSIPPPGYSLRYTAHASGSTCEVWARA